MKTSRTALVTSGKRGIGRALRERLAREELAAALSTRRGGDAATASARALSSIAELEIAA